MMVTLRLLLLLYTAALLVLMPGCWSVKIDRLGLTDERSSAAYIQSEGPPVLACSYTLEEGEVLEEVVLTKDGTVLQTIDDPTGSVSEYTLSELSREDAGDYQCSVTASGGSTDTRYYELLVIDQLPQSRYNKSIIEKDCLFNITFETPQAYPEMTAFCGMWVNDTDADGNLGYWMEEPPEREVKPVGVSYDAESLTLDALPQHRDPQPKLSFSTERGEFTKVHYGTDYTKFDLINAIIKVNDTLVHSDLKCFSGFYKKSGEFVPQISMIGTVTEYFHRAMSPTYTFFLTLQAHVKNKCPANTLVPYASEDVLELEYSEHRITCRNRVAPLSQNGDVQATLRCRATDATVVLQCSGDEWMFRSTDGSLQKGFDFELKSFEEQCESDQAKLDNSNDNGDPNGAIVRSPSCTGIAASTFLLFVLAARR